MPNLYLSVLIIVALNTAAAFAQTEIAADAENVMPAAEAPIPLEADTQTGLWLQLQSSGMLAGSRYALPGQAATLVYQRYLNNFKHPIPLQFNSGSSAAGSTSDR